MNLVFMGTPEIARRALEYLYNNTNHKLLAVVTGPDRPAGRGLKLIPSPVKTTAVKLGVPVFTPEALKDPEFIDRMKEIDADIFIVVAFRILPAELFTIPPKGSINLHGSLLPKYRGAAPINWAIINGETETGLTTFFLKKSVDTGNIIYQEKIKIEPDDNFSALYEKMAEMAGPVIEKTLDLIASDQIEPIKQDDSLATPAPKISPFDCLIDWGFPAKNVVDFIRGMATTPGAYTYFKDSKLKVLRAVNAGIDPKEKLRPGQIIPDKHKLLIAVADGAVEITELLPQGKSKISGNQFLRGYKPADKEIFGEMPKGVTN
ncbi:MAG: methionyl-tRNA formyltransferase [candidate division Zixibacteria bacterium HGW-Zixibacteria-1]|nr:MAG: methionyl-tRNA formyltransferase [candidate division Zixibacteria bacterium HGW-Zixibacteria-1]